MIECDDEMTERGKNENNYTEVISNAVTRCKFVLLQEVRVKLAQSKFSVDNNMHKHHSIHANNSDQQTHSDLQASIDSDSLTIIESPDNTLTTLQKNDEKYENGTSMRKV